MRINCPIWGVPHLPHSSGPCLPIISNTPAKPRWPRWLPPVALLRANGVPIAISTDCNPGSSPCTSLLLMLNMACTLFRLTPEEALAGVTRHAAQALGLADRGVLALAKRADFVLWDVQRPAQLAYALGANPRRHTVFGGEVV